MTGDQTPLFTKEEIEAIEKLAKDPEIHKKIADSIAPGIYGFDEVKEALALQLFGGVPKEFPDGRTVRGDIHILLAGDQGAGKSEFLRTMVRTVPNGIYTSGWSEVPVIFGCTECSRLMAVDDLEMMKADEMYTLRELMDQQPVPCLDADMDAALRTKCTILGAVNPRHGKFDEFAKLSSEIHIPPSLLSRFDLIFVMKDMADRKNDLKFAEALLEGTASAEINLELLKKYIEYAKLNCTPQITPDVKDAFYDAYSKLRSFACDCEKPLPVTPRQFYSLVRLAEASARMRLSPTVEMADASKALSILNECLMNFSYDAQYGSFDAEWYFDGGKKYSRILRKAVKDVIEALESESAEGYAYKEDIIRFLEESYSREEVEGMIEQLDENGEIIIPKPEIVKLFSPLKRYYDNYYHSD